MTKKIESLTPTQEADLTAYRAEWLAVGRSTEPADRLVAETVFAAMYRAIGEAPPAVWWCDGPAVGSMVRAALRDNLYANLSDNLIDNLSDNLRDNLYVNLRANLGANLIANLSDNLRDNLYVNLRANLGANLYANLGDNLGDNLGWPFWGQHEAYWPAYYYWPHVALRPIYSDDEVIRLGWWLTLARSCGWWQPCRGIVFACERPQVQQVDSDGRLHREDGPAMLCRDGWPLWMIHGVLADEQIVLRPETQTVQQVLAETNEEVRRVRIERFGWERFLKESKAKRVDKRHNDRDAQEECLFQLHDGTRRFVCVDPSTGRRYALGVPREIETCEQAQRWMSSGLDAYAVHRS